MIVGAVLAALAGNLLGSGFHSANPGPNVSAAPSPTPTATPTGTASPAATVAVVLPSAISITISNGGGTPAWVDWLGPAGGFLAGVGALGGLVAFRRGGPSAGQHDGQPDGDR